MQRLVRIGFVLLVAAAFVIGCVQKKSGNSSSKSDTGVPMTDGGTWEDGEDAQVVDPPPSLEGDAILEAQVRHISDFPNQIYQTIRTYVSLWRGDLYLQLCTDSRCNSPFLTKKVVDNYLFSQSFAKDVVADNLPAGTFFGRFVLDTEYSQNYGSSYEDDQGFGPFDVIQGPTGAERPSTGNNVPPGTFEVTLTDGQATDVGEMLLGSIIFYEADPSTPTTESGTLLAATTSAPASGMLNTVRILNLSDYTLTDEVLQSPAIEGAGDFFGEICGFVEDEGEVLYVLAVGMAGAYVTAFDTGTMTFMAGEPLFIPHPDYNPDVALGDQVLEPANHPWPCRGVVLNKGGKRFLYLVAYPENTGIVTSSSPHTLTILDITNLAGGGGGEIVDLLEDGDFPTSRLLRKVATDSNKIFAIEPSWSSQATKNILHIIEVDQDGKVVGSPQRIQSGTAESDACGDQIPGLIVAEMGGTAHVFVGNDDDISIYTTDGALVSTINTRDYGQLISSFAVSPDGKTLYAMPTCKSETKKAHSQVGLSDRRVERNRHAVAVVDLTSSPSAPALLYTDRDFDNDGTSDGGIEVQFLNIKQQMLRWCEDCSGATPPTLFIGPKIVAGEASLFMRGVDGLALGPASDIAVYDIATGWGVVFRGYNPWLDGMSVRWGLPLGLDNTAPDAGALWVSDMVFIP